MRNMQNIILLSLRTTLKEVGVKIRIRNISILLISMSFLLAGPSYALDEVLIKSEDGDYAGNGLEYHFTSDLGVFTASRNSYNRNGISLEYTDPVYFRKQIHLAGADLEELTVGVYTDVQRYPFAEAGHPSMDVSLAGGCNKLYGSFEIYEVTYLSDGSVDTLAADLEHYCETSYRKLTAHIRINSTYPIGKVGPIANAGSDQIVLPATNVQLDGSTSLITDLAPFTYSWTQISGPVVSLVDAQTATPTFTSPNLPNQEYEILKFQLAISDDLGRQDFDEVIVNVSEATQPQSVLHYESTGYVGAGETKTLFESATLPFEFVRNRDNGIDFEFSDTLPPTDPEYTGLRGRLNVTGYEGQELDNDHYEFTHRYPFGPPNQPQLDVSLKSAGCNSSIGRFTILEVAYTENGAVQRLAINFEQSCIESSGGLLMGYLRYNSVIPIQSRAPIASAGKNLIYHDDEVVVPLDGGFTRDTDIAGLSYQWQQISGPAVTLNDANAAATYFIAPTSLGMGEGIFEFELVATNASGYFDSGWVQLTVLGANDPKTYFYIEGTPGDFVTLYGGPYFLKPDINYITNRVITNSLGEMTIKISSQGYTDWEVDFANIGGNELQPGIYGDAHRFFTNYTPELNFSGNGRGCNRTDGSFNVHEIEFNSDGTLNRFAADFIQSCDYGSPAFGVIRINSLVPFIDPDPTAIAGSDQLVSISETVFLNGSYSWDLDGLIIDYTWTQIGGTTVTLEDSSSAITSFSIPEGFVSADPLIFQLTVTDDEGGQQIDTVTYTVIGAGEPVTGLLLEGEEGDPIFSGPPQFVHNDDDDFSIVAQSGQLLRLKLGEFDLELGMPDGEAFTVDNYENAVKSSRGILNRPSMSVSNGIWTCNTLSGRFVILELVYDVLGMIERLAVDFEADCSANGNSFRGAARINSLIPLRNPLPNAAAGSDWIIGSGDTVVLDGSKSHDPNGSIVSSEWIQIAGSPVTIVGSNQLVANFSPAAPPDSDVTLIFELSVTDNDGNIDTDEVTITVKGINQPRSTARVFQEAYVGYYEFFLDENTAHTNSAYKDVSQETYLSFRSEEAFSFTIEPISTQLIVPGFFDINDTDSGVDDVFSIQRGSNICSKSVGWLKVHEAEYDSSNNLISLAFDYEVRCGLAKLGNWGSVRFNSNIPESLSVPIADAGDLITADENTMVIISANQSSVPESIIDSYAWRQTSGVTVSLINSSAEEVSFMAPDTNGQQYFEIELEVTVTTNLGYSHTYTVIVRIMEDANQPPSAFNLVTPSNGATGLGASLDLIWEKSTDPDGGDVSYKVTYCNDASFAGCLPSPVSTVSSAAITVAVLGSSFSSFLLIGMLGAGSGSATSLRKKLAYIALIVIFAGTTACGDSGGGGDSSSVDSPPGTPEIAADEIVHSIVGLLTATTYYWKVTAIDDQGAVTESATWSFTTQ